jgi:hypothetical protein
MDPWKLNFLYFFWAIMILKLTCIEYLQWPGDDYVCLWGHITQVKEGYFQFLFLSPGSMPFTLSTYLALALIVSNNFWKLSSFVIWGTRQCRYCYHPHFADEETEAWSSCITCLRSHTPAQPTLLFPAFATECFIHILVDGLPAVQQKLMRMTRHMGFSIQKSQVWAHRACLS